MKYLNLIILFFISASVINAQIALHTTPVVSGTVMGIKAFGDSTYIYGGYLTSVDGQPRNNFACFNTKTGALSAWNPNFSSSVTCFEKVGNHFVMDGSFFTVNGVDRYNICMFNATTGALENWKDTSSVDNGKGSIGVEGHYFYFCKYLTGSGNSFAIAKVDADAGVTTPWRSDTLPDGRVNAILIKDSFVYVGGEFQYFSGRDTIYSQLCRFYKSNGKRDTSWHPYPQCNVSKIESYRDQIFICGSFSMAQGVARPGVAGFDASGHITAFNPVNSSNQIFNIQVTGDFIWLAGNSHQMGGEEKWRIAEVNIGTGIASCWDVSDSSHLWSFAWDVFVSGDTVYIAADKPFIFVGNPRPHPAANAITGSANVLPNHSAVYHMPYTSGHSYTWKVIGGTGTSHVDSITVTWGSGPTGLLKAVENNISEINCNSDTIFLEVNIGTTGIEGGEINRHINISPNPTSDIVHINADFVSGFELFDLQGRLIYNENIQAKTYDINLANLGSGFYILKIQGTGLTTTQKILKN